MAKKVTIYTDGACYGNPGPGGWGAVIIDGDAVTEISGGDPQTTNNRMEMTAIYESLNALPEPSQVTLYSDSQYVVNTMTKGWKRGANRDLWRQIDKAVEKHQVDFRWVKGHAGHEYNERADQLAVAESETFIEAADDEFEADVLAYVGGYGSSDTQDAAWAVVLEFDGRTTELTGTAGKASAYKMELTAAVEALEAFTSPRRVLIYTSGDVVANGMNARWFEKWQKNDWRKADGKPVAHKRLWQRLVEAAQRHETKWRKSDEHAARLRKLVKEGQ